MVVANEVKVSSIIGLSEKEVAELLDVYAKSFGDCESPKEVSAFHGNWVLVGHGKVTNSYCGGFKSFKICNRVELHNQVGLDGVRHGGQVFVRKIHRSCNNPQCPVCYKTGWACREADRINLRIMKASHGFFDAKDKKHVSLGVPQHIVVSSPESDWGLTEFHNEDMRVKIKKLLFNRGVIAGCLIFHGFRFADLRESIEKGVLFGWYWSPHWHCIGFILDGYGKCRSCSKAVRRYRSGGGKCITVHGSGVACVGCDGFEARTRRFYEKDRTIVKVMDERATVFGTAWYQLNHSCVRVVL